MTMTARTAEVGYTAGPRTWLTTSCANAAPRTVHQRNLFDLRLRTRPANRAHRLRRVLAARIAARSGCWRSDRLWRIGVRSVALFAVDLSRQALSSPRTSSVLRVADTGLLAQAVMATEAESADPSCILGALPDLRIRAHAHRVPSAKMIFCRCPRCETTVNVPDDAWKFLPKPSR